MITVTRQVDALPAEVFAVLSDGWLYASWVVGASRIRDVDAVWPKPGAQIHHSFGAWPFVVDDTTEVRHVEPNRSLTLVARGWPVLGEAEIEIGLEREGDGTRVTIREDAVRGPGRLMPKPLRQAAIAPRNHETLRRLAYLAEGRS